MSRIHVLSAPLLAALASCGAEEPIAPCDDCAPTFTLSAQVEILRDANGMVHIYGQSDADVFFASGYMQATDRLFQMELMRRTAYGTRAEVMGPSVLGDDLLIRSLDIAHWGRANADLAAKNDPVESALVDAWVAGINHRIAEISGDPGLLPSGFSDLEFTPQPFTREDAFVIGKAIVFSNANQLEYDLLASLIARYEPDLLSEANLYAPLTDEFIVGGSLDGAKSREVPAGSKWDAPPGAAAAVRSFFSRLQTVRPGASNNWAVSGALTETGGNLIAGDPHQGLRSPSLMWAHHLNSRDGAGSLDVTGWSFVGTPGVSLGHNQRLAWTATTNYPDVTDLWEVSVADGVVTVGGESVALVSRVETVAVRGEEPVEHVVETVPGFGVLLPTDIAPLPIVDPGNRILFNWTGYQATREAQAFVHIAQATTVDQFDAAVDEMELGSFNFIASARSEMTYRSSPLVPLRQAGAAPYIIMDGSDPTSLWSGISIPLEDMPHSRGGDFLISANNDPFGFTRDGDVRNDPFYFGTYFDPGIRARRIHERLDELAVAGPIALESMFELQMDTRSLLADDVIDALDVAWNSPSLTEELAMLRDDPDLGLIHDRLLAWDRTMRRDLNAPVMFEALLSFYCKELVADDMGLFFDPIMERSPIYTMKFALLSARDPEQRLVQQGRDAAILRALEQTSTYLIENFGAVSTTPLWRDFHHTHFPSESLPLYDGGQVSTDGSEATVNVSEARFFSSGEPVDSHDSNGGAIYRMVAEFDPDGTPRAYFNMPRGMDSEPDAPYFNNLTEDWTEGRYRRLVFSREEVLAAAVDQWVLEPW